MDSLPKDDNRLEKILLCSDAIHKRIDELASEIKREYDGEKELCLVGVLKGACFFVVDLARALSRLGMPGITIAFVRASTYGFSIKENGENERDVMLDLLGAKIASKNILIMDDILDQGFTLSSIKAQMMLDFPHANIKTAVLLSKILDNPTPEVLVLRKQFHADFTGFNVRDRWVVGYGMDACEFFRELPYIAIVREECFLK